jgi:hypothetical protein
VKPVVMNQGPYSNPPPGAPWGQPAPSYYGAPGEPPPPEKKKFRFQMWMLGVLIIPVGVTLAVRDVLKTNSIELGGECSDSKHCKSHTCLNGEGGGVCSKNCSPLDGCPAGFACQAISVTLKNQAGSHDLGKQYYCMRGAAPPGSASAAEAATTSPPLSASPVPSASAAPADAASASAAPKPSATAAPKKKKTKH